MSAAVPSAPPPGGPSVPVGEATTSRASDRPPVVVVVQTPEAKKTPFEKYVRSTKRTGVVVFSSLLLILSGLSSIIIEICIQTRADVETRAWQRHYNSYRASSGYSYSEIWLTETFAWAKVGQGFWCGILLFLNGCYGFRIHRDAKQTECSLVKLFWFSMVSTLVCIASVTVSFGALSSRSSWGTFYFLRPTLIALIIDTFFSMVLTVAICCVSCKIACCPGRKQNDSGDEAMTQQQLTEIITSAVTTNQSSQEMSRLVSRAVARQAATGQRMTNRQLRQVITSAVTAATAAQHTEQESLQSENQASPPPPYSKAVAES